MLADGRLSAQAALGEHHLLSRVTISVPLLQSGSEVWSQNT